tara:strand:- start:282 stop:584 length:303 start_codon:yes stop_codon:yes gene_type:complete
MKARLIRDMEPSPGSTPEEWITEVNGKRILAKGLEFEHPEAFWQVLQGNAEAVDAECIARTTSLRSPLQLAAARLASDDLIASMASDPDDTTDTEEENDE